MAAIMLGVGIGGTSIAFSQLNAIFFKSLSVTNPEELLTLSWTTPAPCSPAALAQRGGSPPGVDPNGPSLFSALEDQLGLRLEAKKMPLPVIVIDRIEALAEN